MNRYGRESHSHQTTKYPYELNRRLGQRGDIYMHIMPTLTPMTFFAPALAANMQRMPVPLPTSSTTLSLKRCLLWNMEFLYVRVRTSSFSISCRQTMFYMNKLTQLKLLERKLQQPIFISHNFTKGCTS